MSICSLPAFRSRWECQTSRKSLLFQSRTLSIANGGLVKIYAMAKLIRVLRYLLAAVANMDCPSVLCERVYLHCTSREALSPIPACNPLLTRHQYFPESFLEAVKVRLFAVPTVTPFLIHVI